MHPSALRKRRYQATAKGQEEAKKIGRILGVAKAEEKVSPSHPARVRTDPALAEMYDQEALAGFLAEVREKLEALDIAGDAPPTSIDEVEGVNARVAEALRSHGYCEVEDLQRATAEELVDVPGIGEAKAQTIKEDVGEADDGKEEG